MVAPMSGASVDDRGRLYLPKPLRERYGERFRIVRLHDGIKLIPVSEDPVQGLAETLSPLAEMQREELRAEIAEQAHEDLADDLR